MPKVPQFFKLNSVNYSMCSDLHELEKQIVILGHGEKLT